MWLHFKFNWPVLHQIEVNRKRKQAIGQELISSILNCCCCHRREYRTKKKKLKWKPLDFHIQTLRVLEVLSVICILQHFLIVVGRRSSSSWNQHQPDKRRTKKNGRETSPFFFLLSSLLFVVCFQLSEFRDFCFRRFSLSLCISHSLSVVKCE